MKRGKKVEAEGVKILLEKYRKRKERSKLQISQMLKADDQK